MAGGESDLLRMPAPTPSRRVAIVMSEVFLRRLTPALSHFVRRRFDFRILSIHRERKELAAALRSWRPAGLITEWLPEITDFLVGLGYSTVVADSDELYPGCVSIDVDDREVGREAARHLIRLGHRTFGCLWNQMPYAEQRLAGFEEELERAGFRSSRFLQAEPPGKRYLEDLRDPGANLFRWMADLPKPAAVFAVHDPLGRHLCEACRAAGIRVPGEVAVVGANDDPLVGGLSFPSLSSVRIPWDRIGLAAGEAMQRMLDGGSLPAEALLISPGGVEVRQSSDTLQVGDAMLRKAFAWMDHHHRELVGISDLCREIRVSRRALERKFSGFLRKTPYRVLSEMRVETARRLIVETNEPMPMVAELSGFGDAERLAVVFRRITGRSPTDFRRRAL